MPDEDKTFSGSFVLDLRISWRQAHTLYYARTPSDFPALTQLTFLSYTFSRAFQFSPLRQGACRQLLHLVAAGHTGSAVTILV